MPHFGYGLPGKGKPAREGHLFLGETHSILFSMNELQGGKGSIMVVIFPPKAWSSSPSVMGIYLQHLQTPRPKCSRPAQDVLKQYMTLC